MWNLHSNVPYNKVYAVAWFDNIKLDAFTTNWQPGKMLEVALGIFFLPLFARGCHHSRADPSRVHGSSFSRIRPFTMGAYCTKEFGSNILFCWNEQTLTLTNWCIHVLHNTLRGIKYISLLAGLDWLYNTMVSSTELMHQSLYHRYPRRGYIGIIQPLHPMHIHTFLASAVQPVFYSRNYVWIETIV